MDQDKREYFRQRLEHLEEVIRADKTTHAEDEAAPELDQQRVGRLSRMDAMQQQAMAVALGRRRDIQLKRIQGAYTRLDEGTYGQCAKCGETIPEERLDIDPTAFFCVKCAAEAELR